MLPKEIARLVPKSHLMTESEWRGIGVQQSRGWVSSSLDPTCSNLTNINLFIGSLHDSWPGTAYPFVSKVL